MEDNGWCTTYDEHAKKEGATRPSICLLTNATIRLRDKYDINRSYALLCPAFLVRFMLLLKMRDVGGSIGVAVRGVGGGNGGVREEEDTVR